MDVLDMIIPKKVSHRLRDSDFEQIYTLITYRQLSVEQSVLVDGGVALCDPGEPVAGAALAVHAAVEHWRVWVS